MRIIITITTEVDTIAVCTVLTMVGIKKEIAVLKVVGIPRKFAVHHIDSNGCHLSALS